MLSSVLDADLLNHYRQVCFIRKVESKCSTSRSPAKSAAANHCLGPPPLVHTEPDPQPEQTTPTAWRCRPEGGSLKAVSCLAKSAWTRQRVVITPGGTKISCLLTGGSKSCHWTCREQPSPSIMLPTHIVVLTVIGGSVMTGVLH